MIVTVYIVMIAIMVLGEGLPTHGQVAIEYFVNREPCEQEAERLNKEARPESRAYAICQEKSFVMEK